MLNSPAPGIFLIGVIGIGLLTNGLSSAITAHVNDENALGGWITFIIGAALLALGIWLFDLVAGNLHIFSRKGLYISEQVQRQRGLVALVSQGSQGSPQTKNAMEYHLGTGSETPRLEYCWLIVGPGDEDDPKSPIFNARALKQIYGAKGVNVILEQLRSSEDPKEVYQIVNDIYQTAKAEYSLDESEMIADFTAGTKSMTFGMTLACSDQGWPLQFMRVVEEKDLDDRGRAASGAQSIPVFIDVDFFTNRKRDAEK